MTKINFAAAAAFHSYEFLNSENYVNLWDSIFFWFEDSSGILEFLTSTKLKFLELSFISKSPPLKQLSFAFKHWRTLAAQHTCQIHGSFTSFTYTPWLRFETWNPRKTGNEEKRRKNSNQNDFFKWRCRQHGYNSTAPVGTDRLYPGSKVGNVHNTWLHCGWLHIWVPSCQRQDHEEILERSKEFVPEKVWFWPGQYNKRRGASICCYARIRFNMDRHTKVSLPSSISCSCPALSYC